MKKTITMMLATILAVSLLAACGDSKANGDPATTTTAGDVTTVAPEETTAAPEETTAVEEETTAAEDEVPADTTAEEEVAETTAA